MPQWGQRQGAVLPTPGGAGEVLTSTGADWESQPAAAGIDGGNTGDIPTWDGSEYVPTSPVNLLANRALPQLVECLTDPAATALAAPVGAFEMDPHCTVWCTGVAKSASIHPTIDPDGLVQQMEIQGHDLAGALVDIMFVLKIFKQWVSP